MLLPLCGISMTYPTPFFRSLDSEGRVAGSQGAKRMYGLIAKLTTVPGQREKMIGILKESASGMPGCVSYVVAKDSANENVLWVTEIWDSVASHDASLSLPAVRKAIPRAKPIVSRFEKIAVTTPVWGVGLTS
jgi:quinol monooxygenase YgiN